MTKVQEIESAVKKLSPMELEEFRAWFREHDWAIWEAKIKEDSDHGRLDALINDALDEKRRGLTREL